MTKRKPFATAPTDPKLRAAFVEDLRRQYLEGTLAASAVAPDNVTDDLIVAIFPGLASAAQRRAS